MCNEKYKVSNRNPYDLAQVSTSNNTNIFITNFGHDNRSYDYRVHKLRPQPRSANNKQDES